MADLIGATSLLAAIVAALYSVWYPELRATRAMTVQRKRADRNSDIRVVESALRTRAISLVIASTILCLVLTPDCVRVLATAADGVVAAMAGAAPPYDSLAAVFVVAYAFLVGLAALGWSQAIGLVRLLGALRGPDV